MKSPTIVAYQTRNVVTLAVFFLVVASIGGYFTFYKYPHRLSFYETELKRINQQIKSLDGINRQFEMIQEQIKDEQAKLAELDKQIVVNTTPAQTYTYINEIMNYAGEFKIDLMFAGSGAGDGYGYKIYNLRGEGTFHNIYRFVWYLERGPQIYKVKSLQIRGTERRDPETNKTKLIVPFEMQIWALHAQIEDLPPIKRKLKDVMYAGVKNIFYPYVTRDIPGNVDNLLEVDRAELQAVMPGKAFVVDHTGNVRILAPGDKVYLGYVTRIDPGRNEVEFTLNKGGIVEKYTLTLGFDDEDVR